MKLPHACFWHTRVTQSRCQRLVGQRGNTCQIQKARCEGAAGLIELAEGPDLGRNCEKTLGAGLDDVLRNRDARRDVNIRMALTVYDRIQDKEADGGRQVSQIGSQSSYAPAGVLLHPGECGPCPAKPRFISLFAIAGMADVCQELILGRHCEFGSRMCDPHHPAPW